MNYLSATHMFFAIIELLFGDSLIRNQGVFFWKGDSANGELNG